MPNSNITEYVGKKINSFIVIIAFSLTLEKLNRSPKRNHEAYRHWLPRSRNTFNSNIRPGSKVKYNEGQV